jgi:hypothetical protein
MTLEETTVMKMTFEKVKVMVVKDVVVQVMAAAGVAVVQEMD